MDVTTLVRMCAYLKLVHSVKGIDLSELYSENVAAKVFQVAQRGLKQQV
jgi:hypothetical protein